MINRVLAGCSLFALVTVGSMPAQAQSPSTAPAKPAPSTAPAPAQKPAPNNGTPAQKPAAPAAPAAATNVSPDELKKFANAVKQMLSIARDAETQMNQAVQQTGLSEARFNEIYLAKRDPAAKPNSKVTPKEEQSYNQAVSRLGEIQKGAQAKMDQVVKSEGFAPDRFGQIFAAVQGNPQLKQEVQKLIQN